MTDDRKATLLARIRALQAKTTENGCTEAEALAAAMHAAKLLDQYGFSSADLELPPEAITEETYFGNSRQLQNLVFATNAIAFYCDCKVWAVTLEGKPKQLKYFGRESDAAVAMYLTHLIHTAMERAWREFLPMRDQAKRRNVQRKALQVGFAIRVSQRLKEMKAARNAEQHGEKTGRDLVVVKNAVVDAAWAEKNLKLKEGGKIKPIKHNAAFAHGWAAGGNVALNDGITSGGNGAPLKIR